MKTHRFPKPVRELAPKQSPLFDLRPMSIGGFELRGRTVIPHGRPTLEGWTQAMQVAGGAHESSPYWIIDLMAYGEQREDWKDRLDQALSDTGYSRQTIYNLHYTVRHTTEEARKLAPSVAHLAVVAKLKPKEQCALLEEAKDEGWNLHEFRREVRAKNRRKVIEGQAILKGQYRVILADPPWLYGNRPPSGSGAKDHFPPMTIEQLSALPVEKHAYPNAVLFCWVTAPMLYEQPGPNEVIRAWGFTPKTGMVWDKVLQAGGNYVAVRHEHLLIATRGSCTPDHLVPMVDSVQTIRRPDGFEHSEKPEEFRKIIERLYDKGPYLEIFGRHRAENWDVFGNDARLWEATG